MKVLCGVVYLASTAALMSMLPPSFKNIMISTTMVMFTENMQRTNYSHQDQDVQMKLFRTVLYIHALNTHLHENTAFLNQPLPHKQWVQAMSLLASRSIIVRYARYNRVYIGIHWYTRVYIGMRDITDGGMARHRHIGMALQGHLGICRNILIVPEVGTVGWHSRA